MFVKWKKKKKKKKNKFTGNTNYSQQIEITHSKLQITANSAPLMDTLFLAEFNPFTPVTYEAH